jgi:hypothetical protein
MRDLICRLLQAPGKSSVLNKQLAEHQELSLSHRQPMRHLWAKTGNFLHRSSPVRLNNAKGLCRFRAFWKVQLSQFIERLALLNRLISTFRRFGLS